MVLITVLIALVVQRFANMAGWLRSSWFEIYLGWLRPVLAKSNKWVAIVIVMLPVFFVLGILHAFLMWRLFGLFYLVLSCAVLLFCMDARNIKNQLVKYFEFSEKQDVNGAVNVIAELTTEPLPHNLAELDRVVTRLIFTKSYVNIFSVLFWFGVLNIYGAAGYTILVLLRRLAVRVDGSFGDIAVAAGFIQDILDWAPTRFLSLTYALVGHFSQGFSYFLKHLKTGLNDNMNIAVESGLSALGLKIEENTGTWSENKAALDLIDRTLIIWIVIVALITLGMLI